MNLQPSTGYRFDGSGYAIVSSRPYRMRERSDVQLKFKTTARDGLLFLAGKGHTFLSVELRDGNVVYQVWHLLFHPKIFKHCHALDNRILITRSGCAVLPVILYNLHGKYVYFS